MHWLWDFVKYTTYVLTFVELLFLENADMCLVSVCSWIGHKLIPVFVTSVLVSVNASQVAAASYSE